MAATDSGEDADIQVVFSDGTVRTFTREDGYRLVYVTYGGALVIEREGHTDLLVSPRGWMNAGMV